MKEIGILTHVHSALTKKMEYFFLCACVKNIVSEKNYIEIYHSI